MSSCVAGDGFTASVLPELAGCRQADARAGARDGAARASCATTAPHYARDGYDYWHQLPDGRLVLGGNATRRSRPRRPTSRRRPS